MLHPQARALLHLIEEKGVPPTHTLSPKDARAFYRDRRTFTQPEPAEVAEVRDLRCPGPLGEIALRLYRPAGSQPSAMLPVLVYFHGGGFVIGDLDTHDSLCRQLANASGCAVVAVDYRMGPEHRFPAASDDSVAATRWIHANAAELHLDAGRLAVGGDSAGGNLAAVVALALRDTGGPAIAMQLLIYPATDQRFATLAHVTNGQGYLLTRDTIAYFHDHYFDRKDDLDWRASPLLHPDLSKLPPALVLTAGFDPLRDDGMVYAQRLTESGVRTTLVDFPRQIHGFITMGRVFDEANAAVDMCAAQLRLALR